MKTIISIIMVIAARLHAGTITMEWLPINGVAINYTLEIKQGAENDPGEWTALVSTPETFLTVSDLTPGLWSFRVRSVTLDGLYASLPSDVVTEIISPDTPQGLKRRKIAVQQSHDMEHWQDFAIIDVPEMNRAFYRIAFTQ